MPRKKVNKITSDDHKKLTDYYGKLNSMLNQIGDLEVKKAQIVLQHAQGSEQFSQFSSGLEHKYGKVAIDINTGEYKTEDELAEEKLQNKKGGADKKT